MYSSQICIHTIKKKKRKQTFSGTRGLRTQRPASRSPVGCIDVVTHLGWGHQRGLLDSASKQRVKRSKQMSPFASFRIPPHGPGDSAPSSDEADRKPEPFPRRKKAFFLLIFSFVSCVLSTRCAQGSFGADHSGKLPKMMRSSERGESNFGRIFSASASFAGTQMALRPPPSTLRHPSHPASDWSGPRRCPVALFRGCPCDCLPTNTLEDVRAVCK